MTTRRRIDHGTFCYTAVKEGLIDVERSAHVGIRTVVEDNLGIAIHDAREVHAQGGGRGGADLRARAGDGARLSQLRHRRARPGLRARDRHAGLGRAVERAQAGLFLRGLAGINLIGGDVVEVSPPFDHAASPRGRRPCPDGQICLWGWTRR
jgi:agmatinase